MDVAPALACAYNEPSPSAVAIRNRWKGAGAGNLGAAYANLRRQVSDHAEE